MCCLPTAPATLQVEVHVEEFKVISRADPLPLDVNDAARRDVKASTSAAEDDVRPPFLHHSLPVILSLQIQVQA